MISLSVIVPIYNRIDYVNNLVRMLVNQTYTNCEFIIVDDGSTDGTYEKLQELADDRFVILKSEHKGPSAARNLGLDVAKGTYIRFVDSDDIISSQSNERLIIPIIESDCDLVIGNFTYESREYYYEGKDIKQGMCPMKDFVLDFLEHRISYYYGVVWNKIYKKIIIDANNIRFDEERIWCEDYEFNVRYYTFCDNVYYLNIDGGIYHYIDNGESITSSIENMDLVAVEKHNEWCSKVMEPLCIKWGTEHEQILAFKFNELQYRLQDIYDNYGPSVKTCYAEYKKEMSEEFVNEYISTHGIKKSFSFYYFRGMLRSVYNSFIPMKIMKRKKGNK